MGDECLRKLECRYATENLLDRPVFGLGTAFCYLHLLVMSGAFVVLFEGSDMIEYQLIVRYYLWYLLDIR